MALLVKQLLDLVGLESFPKTSGSRGIHVLVPIARRHGFDETRAFAAVDRRRARAHASRARDDRVDEAQATRRARRREPERARARRRPSVYSVRPRAGAPVSTPLAWDEVREGLDPDGVHDGRGPGPRRPSRRPLRAGARAASVARSRAALDRLIVAPLAGLSGCRSRLEPLGMPEARQLGDVAPEEERRRPVGDDAQPCG